MSLEATDDSLLRGSFPFITRELYFALPLSSLILLSVNILLATLLNNNALCILSNQHTCHIESSI